MKKNILTMVALAASVIGIAEARTITIWVNGSGMATEPDRASAVSEASDYATQQANAICTGTVVNVEPTSTLCFGGDNDSPYVCTVFVKAACQITGK